MPGVLLDQAQKIKKNSLSKNFLYFFQKELFLIFWEMEHSSLKIEKFLIFSYILGNGTFLYFLNKKKR